jgi:hypothetical protein
MLEIVCYSLRSEPEWLVPVDHVDCISPYNLAMSSSLPRSTLWNVGRHIGSPIFGAATTCQSPICASDMSMQGVRLEQINSAGQATLVLGRHISFEP